MGSFEIVLAALVVVVVLLVFLIVRTRGAEHMGSDGDPSSSITSYVPPRKSSWSLTLPSHTLSSSPYLFHTLAIRVQRRWTSDDPVKQSTRTNRVAKFNVVFSAASTGAMQRELYGRNFPRGTDINKKVIQWADDGSFHAHSDVAGDEKYVLDPANDVLHVTTSRKGKWKLYPLQ